MASLSCRFILIVTFSWWISLALSELSSDFYGNICPQFLPTVRLVVFSAIAKEPRIGASLVRLHFHDCFVNGCDASVLLDDTASFTGEKTALPNNNSLRGFEVIDEIKAAVNLACLGNVVSCADILAVAARDSIVALGGAPYNVLLGRRDATTASFDAANNDLPAPIFDLPYLISNFESHNLSVQDLVALSGAHSLGFARCTTFRSRIYNESSAIDHSFAQYLQAQCPPINGEGDDILAPLDDSPARFDTEYFDGLRLNRGVLHSDQQLFRGDGGEVDSLVRYYSEQREVFWADFGASMVKMGNLSPLLGSEGEIRGNCRNVNVGS